MIAGPTCDTIRRRLRVKIDGTPGASTRALDPKGHRVFYNARRDTVVACAIRWQALGYTEVEISLPPKHDLGKRNLRPFPATQEEAIAAVRELATMRNIIGHRWKRFARRFES